MTGAYPFNFIYFKRRLMTTSNSLLPYIPSRYDQPKLKTLPLREQPAYRVSQNAAACNLTELLAAVIGGQRQIEISQALLARFDGDIRRLYQAHPAELAAVKGISQATAARIKAALNLGLRLNLPNEERPMINSPADAAALVQYEMSLLEKEHLRVLLLDRRNRVLDIVQIYEGSVALAGPHWRSVPSRHPTYGFRDHCNPQSSIYG
jgi:DNA repair protein RadC